MMDLKGTGVWKKINYSFDLAYIFRAGGLVPLTGLLFKGKIAVEILKSAEAWQCLWKSICRCHPQ